MATLSAALVCFPEQRSQLWPRPWEIHMADLNLGFQGRIKGQNPGHFRAGRTVVVLPIVDEVGFKKIEGVLMHGFSFGSGSMRSCGHGHLAGGMDALDQMHDTDGEAKRRARVIGYPYRAGRSGHPTLLGHESIAATQIYRHAGLERLSKWVEGMCNLCIMTNEPHGVSP
jgi:hypothetical protein